MKNGNKTSLRLGRRTFLKNGTLILTSAAISRPMFGDDQQEIALKVGLVTDLHYADKPPRGSRHYRETPDKLAEAAEHFGKHEPAFIVELGDFIDAADSVDAELGYLNLINRDFSASARGDTTCSATIVFTRSPSRSSSTALSKRDRTTRST